MNKELQNRSQLSFIPQFLYRVTTSIIENTIIQKLLFYSDKHALSLPVLTDFQKSQLPNNYVKIVPKFEKDFDLKTFIVVTVDSFTQSENKFLKEISFTIDIICHVDCWVLDDWNIRPLSILSEIDSMLNEWVLGSQQVCQITGGHTVPFSKDYTSWQVEAKFKFL